MTRTERRLLTQGLRLPLGSVVLAMTLTACSVAADPGSDFAEPSAAALASQRAIKDEVVASDDPAGELPLPPQVLWDHLATGNLPGALSLGEAVADSDLIVVGRWIDLERGDPYWTPENETVGWFAVAVIEVDSLIQGSLPDARSQTIRVPFLLSFGLVGSVYPEKEFDAVDRALPKDPAVLFLWSWSKSLALAGSDVPGTEVPDWVKGLNRPDIYRTIGTDGALPLEDGSVSDVVYEFDMPRWRIDLAGQKLDTIVTRVMAAAEPTAP